MSKRRANGEGNLRKRSDGRWEGRYTAGYDPDTGKRIIKNGGCHPHRRVHRGHLAPRLVRPLRPAQHPAGHSGPLQADDRNLHHPSDWEDQAEKADLPGSPAALQIPDGAWPGEPAKV